MKFSLSFFANLNGLDAPEMAEQYDFLFEMTEYADQNGYYGVWIPERHLHPFGGQFPNPSQIAATIARLTRRIRIQAGSVVLPLHSPIRVAEEWAVVDQLSRGRVTVAFASGWNEKDFAIAPSKFRNRKEIMKKGIPKVQALWENRDENLEIFPKPFQKRIPVGVASAGANETCYEAGLNGYNILTHFMKDSYDHLRERLEHYRAGLKEGGHDIREKEVTILLHTYIDEDMEKVEQVAKEPFFSYQSSFLNLFNSHEFASERQREVARNILFQKFSPEYSLIGTEESCLEVIGKLDELGVTEIAALVDFGVAPSHVRASLSRLTNLTQRYVSKQGVKAGEVLS